MLLLVQLLYILLHQYVEIVRKNQNQKQTRKWMFGGLVLIKNSLELEIMRELEINLYSENYKIFFKILRRPK